MLSDTWLMSRRAVVVVVFLVIAGIAAVVIVRSRDDSASASGCPVQAPVTVHYPDGSTKALLPPPLPTIKVVRTGDRSVDIRYQFCARPDDAPAPSTILTTLDSPGDRWVPMTVRTPAEDRGTISQELPPGGDMPDNMLVSVDAANGLRSKVLSLPIPTET
jgi:hypothetical protein